MHSPPSPQPSAEPPWLAAGVASAHLLQRVDHLVRRTKDALKLSYRVSGQPVDDTILVVSTAMHFGGRREWLLCPGCGCE